jgi:hypothetical protein
MEMIEHQKDKPHFGQILCQDLEEALVGISLFVRPILEYQVWSLQLQ